MGFDQIELFENPYHAEDTRKNLKSLAWREEDVIIVRLVALLYNE